MGSVMPSKRVDLAAMGNNEGFNISPFGFGDSLDQVANLNPKPRILLLDLVKGLVYFEGG
ncbi:hypothetical protein BFJ63_vAg17160 [Fusarium oxysporum f. sp. narcissi]|jgi:hypothetical protein|uniref:Uncharacterized protein n=1 Tax=Fusarium oxysporum f. sp. narcissi TaxID=451672 RepID=A0A4Q2V0E6_FUSOX|nr:hypothetical protein BFJ66_g17314 [Fusarium oxysporum f. sp. cepae]RKK27020.1 hypothetical protein BFJ67_g16341 [Fusarium oxysporum f. sp. cepae]RYC79962.1 hypothetical protein BFJ63_vAg17160 [Fusarium oxysporum f. sp. narcissi]